MIRNILYNSMKNHYEATCENCKTIFWRHNRQKLAFKNAYKSKSSSSINKFEFCSRECMGKYHDKKLNLNCGWCNKDVVKKFAEFKRSISGLVFCDRSCSASYNNTQKRRSLRSKCEKMFFDLLKEKYTNLDLIANDKKMLDGLEADVAIPSLNLAIEWNGIVHYKPIYGEEKLNKIKSIDERKQNLAQQKGIRLIVIPDLVSNEKYVKEAFYNTCRIIDELLYLSES